MAYIEFRNVYKEYGSGETVIKALDGADFIVEKGELAVILGSSGAGKTTALNILGGMDRATGGLVSVDGKDITALKKKQLVAYRRHDIGFVFQFYNLVPNLPSFPAGNSSGFPLPARLPKTRSFFYAMSRPAPSTTRPASRFCRSCRTHAAKRGLPS